MIQDFTPTKETISLHGLGFVQVVLPGNQRLHVWHPDLPRRDCYAHSSIHNHRFAFLSRVLKGTQVNERVDMILTPPDGGTHRVISHDGPRSPKDGRVSVPVAECTVRSRGIEDYHPGQEYEMAALDYHRTPCTGIVITLMTKLHEGTIHATSLCAKEATFHQDFDRFQLGPQSLWGFVRDAFAS